MDHWTKHRGGRRTFGNKNSLEFEIAFCVTTPLVASLQLELATKNVILGVLEID